MVRFATSQRDRSLVHHKLPQGDDYDDYDNDCNETKKNAQRRRPPPEDFTFVVTADTQFGMVTENKNWDIEMEYSRQVIRQINAMNPPPLFCCLCGDLVHMTAELSASDPDDKNTNNNGNNNKLSREACDAIQDEQNKDFKTIWSELNQDIALVCLCGNHDIGNRPTPVSIQRFRQEFGDDYLAFWAKHSYNIVLNTSLFNDPSGAPELFERQWQWLNERLQYAERHEASHIFVFGHHPWFLYHEDEDPENGGLPCGSSLAPFGKEGSVSDGYFVMSLEIRKKVLALFQRYGVKAAFAGHFHQNMVSKTSFGMSMITTSALSVLLESTGIPKDFDEPKALGMRIVEVDKEGSFRHRFVSLYKSDDIKMEEMP